MTTRTGKEEGGKENRSKPGVVLVVVMMTSLKQLSLQQDTSLLNLSRAPILSSEEECCSKLNASNEDSPVPKEVTFADGGCVGVGNTKEVLQY